VTGDGSSDTSMSFTGTLTDINNALAAGVSYLGQQNFSGSDSLVVTVDDQGNSGADPTNHAASSASLTASSTLTFTVRSVNDAPVATVPSAQTVDEDTSLVFSSATTKALSITDIDAASGMASSP
jgi:hypothetical protein